MDYQKTMRDIKELSRKITDIEMKARREGRDLTLQEDAACNEMLGAIDAMEKTLPANAPLSLSMNGSLGRTGTSPRRVFGSLGEQMKAVANAAYPGANVDPRLHQITAAASGLNETVPSEGNFLVETDFSRDILQNSFNEGQLARRCRQQPIGPNASGVKINGVDETSRATGSRFGGVRSYWGAEADELNASKPKFRQIGLELKKQHVLIYATDDLLQDAVALEGFIREVAPKEIGFNTDSGIIEGSGAGTMLGILSAGCLIQVAKETGQRADTIVAENVIKMFSRTLGRSSNYVWLYNKTVLPQLFTLSLAVGTGGVPLFIAAGGASNAPENRLLGLPLLEVEQCAALGDLGDLILADLGNGYIVADKGEVRADVSIHVRFLWDESVFRFIYRVDGQPVLASPITPYKGGAGATQSHFIALAERA